MTTGRGTVPLPAALDEIAEDFAALSARDRLTLLLDFSDGLTPGPARAVRRAPRSAREGSGQCQTPLFLLVEVDEAATSENGTRHL